VLSGPLEFRGAPAGDSRDTTGRVLLRVDVSATGAVDAVTIVETDSASAFGEDARRALAFARFRPALKNGRAVRSRILVDVDYAKPD
jgi:protein TonB